MVIIPLLLRMLLTLSNWWLGQWSKDCFIKSLKEASGPSDVQLGFKATKSHQSQQ